MRRLDGLGEVDVGLSVLADYFGGGNELQMACDLSVIVDDAPQSVVCVPPQARVATRTIPELRATLVATDLSPFANRAVPYAFALVANVPEAEVHVRVARRRLRRSTSP